MSKITFPDLPVAFDCDGYNLLDVKGVTKCGNMDAYMIIGEIDGQIISFLISVPAILAIFNKHIGDATEDALKEAR